jgi:ABC-2 type transport system permease protein
MIGGLMRRLPPGSFAWLTLHELRLGLRASATKAWMLQLGAALLAIWTLVGVGAGLLLRSVEIVPGPEAYAAAAVTALGIFSFMATQAMLASQRTLYEAGDLDLLFSAPIAPRTVIAAKLAGIIAMIAYTYALLVLPIALPVAALGHPELFGIPALLAALALAAGCLGLAVTLTLARLAGPRAARTVGQVVAALAGGAVFLASQLGMQGSRHSQSGHSQSAMELMFDRIVASGAASHGVGGLPGRAAFGDPLAILLVVAIGTGLFVLAAAGMQTLFLSSYRAGGMKLGGRRKARGRVAKHFRATLFATVFSKEWRLLARDPALAFQIVLRIIYLVPLFIVAFRPDSDIPFGPSLAFASVVIAGQVVGSFTWLAVAAEDTPDLIAIAPVEKDEVDRIKLMAAMTMAAPLILLLPVAIAFETLPGAAVALAATALAGWTTGKLEIRYSVPAPRSTFRKRQSGSWIVGLLGMLISVGFGAVAAAAVYLL